MNDEVLDTDATNAINTVSDNTDKVLLASSERILTSISKDEHCGVVALSTDIAKELSLEYSFVYGIISAYISANPALICAKGKGMGVMLKSKYDKLQEIKAEELNKKTFSK